MRGKLAILGAYRLSVAQARPRLVRAFTGEKEEETVRRVVKSALRGMNM
jgi:hypothetical protein